MSNLLKFSLRRSWLQVRSNSSENSNFESKIVTQDYIYPRPDKTNSEDLKNKRMVLPEITDPNNLPPLFQNMKETSSGKDFSAIQIMMPRPGATPGERMVAHFFIMRALVWVFFICGSGVSLMQMLTKPKSIKDAEAKADKILRVVAENNLLPGYKLSPVLFHHWDQYTEETMITRVLFLVEPEENSLSSSSMTLDEFGNLVESKPEKFLILGETITFNNQIRHFRQNIDEKDPHFVRVISTVPPTDTQFNILYDNRQKYDFWSPRDKIISTNGYLSSRKTFEDDESQVIHLSEFERMCENFHQPGKSYSWVDRDFLNNLDEREKNLKWREFENWEAYRSIVLPFFSGKTKRELQVMRDLIDKD